MLSCRKKSNIFPINLRSSRLTRRASRFRDSGEQQNLVMNSVLNSVVVYSSSESTTIFEILIKFPTTASYSSAVSTPPSHGHLLALLAPSIGFSACLSCSDCGVSSVYSGTVPYALAMVLLPYRKFPRPRFVIEIRDLYFHTSRKRSAAKDAASHRVVRH